MPKCVSFDKFHVTHRKISLDVLPFSSEPSNTHMKGERGNRRNIGEGKVDHSDETRKKKE